MLKRNKSYHFIVYDDSLERTAWACLLFRVPKQANTVQYNVEVLQILTSKPISCKNKYKDHTRPYLCQGSGIKKYVHPMVKDGKILKPKPFSNVITVVFKLVFSNCLFTFLVISDTFSYTT